MTVKSKLGLGCLNELATHNLVQLVWVLGHKGILGNERADELAKKGADTPLTGPEPVLAYRTAWSSKQSGTGWRGNSECWKSGKECKHSKALMEGPQQGRAIKLLNMSRQQLSVVIGLLIGYLGLNVHLYKIGKDINPLCRRCFYGNETVNTCYVNVNP